MTYEEQNIYFRLKKQGSKIEAEIFKMTVSFSLQDWRNIRDKKYWLELNSIPIQQHLRRLKYKYEAIKRYVAK